MYDSRYSYPKISSISRTTTSKIHELQNPIVTSKPMPSDKKNPVLKYREAIIQNLVHDPTSFIIDIEVFWTKRSAFTRDPMQRILNINDLVDLTTF